MERKIEFIPCDICSSDTDGASYCDITCSLCKENHNLCSMCYELGHNENYGGLNNTGVYWGETFENATSRTDICKKCGNPLEMYWCEDCELNSEEEYCDRCGNVEHTPKLDKDYHLDCN